MSKQKSTRQRLLDECDRLTASLPVLSFEDYKRAKIRLDMYTRILEDGWLHE